jgi:hypothetical protein
MRISQSLIGSAVAFWTSMVVVAAAVVGCGQADARSDSKPEPFTTLQEANGKRLQLRSLEEASSASAEGQTSEQETVAAEYDQVHPSDEYAAHPRDPDRMAPGDFSGAAKAGYESGRQFHLGVAMQVDRARADAQLFYDRPGCASPVAKRFFKNIENYCTSLDSASFRKEVERNFQR